MFLVPKELLHKPHIWKKHSIKLAWQGNYRFSTTVYGVYVFLALILRRGKLMNLLLLGSWTPRVQRDDTIVQ